jgi:hypothetical protein
VQEHQTLPTLLGYLNPGASPARLNVVLASEGFTPEREQRFPFFLVTDSDPLTRVLRARFETQAGSIIHSVFLLMQKDRYSQAATPLTRLTNTDIEIYWQNATRELLGASSALKPIVLTDRTDADGKPLPFHSLFACKTTGLFFHPPCPHCGEELALCRDDEYLVSQRLRPYSTSLSRYLHCPGCRSSGSVPLFYAYEPDAFDPPMVKDRWALIQEYARLVESGIRRPGLPCHDCGQAANCLNASGQLSTTLMPFSFYPFYLLAFNTLTFHAPDFLCLASGGSLDELKKRLIQRGEMGKLNHLEVEAGEWSGPQESFFFFRKKERFFLEVLYLKLAFLSEVANMAIFDRGGPGLVDLVGSLDRIWVNLPSQNRTLPRLWNFQIGFLDVFRGAPGAPPQLKLPPTYALHLMGVLWLTALLTNETQDASLIQQAIDIYYSDEMQASDESSEPLYRSHTVFQPGNLFWNPEALELSGAMEGLWHQSLSLGWWLMRAGFRMSPDWSPEKFKERLAGLLESVKEELFSASSRPEPAVGSEDDLLAALLTDLLTKWTSLDEVRGEEQPADLGSREMVDSGFPEDATLPLELHRQQKEEWGPETLILSPLTAQPDGSLATPPLGGPRETEEPPRIPAPVEIPMEETVVLAPGKPETGQETEDLLPETIILSPGTPLGARKTGGLEPPSGQPVGPESPSDAPESPEGQTAKAAPDEDDLMMETIILRPKNSKDG